MKKYYDSKINHMVYEIIAGEVVSTNKRNVVLATLLGSCVSVCFTDKINRVYGMNHFMLPGQLTQPGLRDARYGIYATNSLIAEMEKQGAERKYLEAKVFGAGRVFDTTVFDVARDNAEFILKYLSALEIPVAAQDLGKQYGRKILFSCKTGEVYVKKITDFSASPEALERERQFFVWLQSDIGGICNA